MAGYHWSQSQNQELTRPGSFRARELITPNPKLKLMEQVREVLRLKHYAIRTEQAYCDWIRRYIFFHRMKLREELTASPESKIEEFLSDLAVNGQVCLPPGVSPKTHVPAWSVGTTSTR